MPAWQIGGIFDSKLVEISPKLTENPVVWHLNGTISTVI
jgi:hypothetical protein